MDAVKILQSFNLNQKQATVYVTCLELGPASGYEMALKSGLKRPTVYVVISELMKMGFLKLIRRKHKNYYQAVSPDKMLKLWKNNLKLLEQVTPELHQLVKKSKSRPRVEFYQGVEGIKQAYAELEPDIYHGQELCWFGSCGEGFEANFPERIGYWQKIAKDKRHRGREILDRTPQNIKLFEKIKQYHLPHYHIRYVEPGKLFGPIDVALFKDSVYIISLMRDLFAIKITSQQVKDACQLLYELAWQQAKEIR